MEEHCYVVVLLSEDADSRSLLFLLKRKGLAKSVSVVDAVKGAAVLGLPTRHLTSLSTPGETTSSNTTAPKKPIYALVHLEDDADIDYCSTFLIEGGIAKHVTLIDDAQAASLLGLSSSHQNALLHSADNESPQDDNKKASTSQLGAAEMNTGTPLNVKETTPDSDFNAGEMWPEGDNKDMTENDEETRGEPSVIDEDVKDSPPTLCTPLLQLPPPPSTEDVKADLDEVDKAVKESRKRKNDGGNGMSNVDEANVSDDGEVAAQGGNDEIARAEDEGNAQCALCPSRIRLGRAPKWAMIFHAKHHHPQKQFRCVVCGYERNGLNALFHHQVTRHGVNERPIEMTNKAMEKAWLEWAQRCFPVHFRPYASYNFPEKPIDPRSIAIWQKKETRGEPLVIDEDVKDWPPLLCTPLLHLPPPPPSIEDVKVDLDEDDKAVKESRKRKNDGGNGMSNVEEVSSSAWDESSSLELVTRENPEEEAYECALCSAVCTLRDDGLATILKHAKLRHGVKRFRCACYSCGYGSHFITDARHHQAVMHAIFDNPIDMCDANMQMEWRETMKLCFPALIPRINEYHFRTRIKFDGRSSAFRWFDGLLDHDYEVIAQGNDEEMAGQEEEARTVPCMLCPKAIKAFRLGHSPKWPMISHAKRHHHQKQFRCVACSYECNASSAVYQHQVNHHGVKERPIDLTNKKLESAWLEWAQRCFPVQFRQLANCDFVEKPIDPRSLAIWREKETPTNDYA